jgi:ATP-binding cassette subfamily B protein
MLNLRKLEKSFCRQKDQSDCGVACLSSLIAYYGGYVPLETLREESGTGPTGTTMLGLFQAALKAGMKAKGFSADLDQLSSLGKPCLLHVIQEGRILHFVICYGYQNENFLIGDPAKGIVWMSSGQLDAIWSSRKLLLLEPGDAFVQRSRSTGLQRAWFLGLLRCDWNILATSAFLGVVISVLGLSVAIFTQKLVDDILPNGRTKNLAVGIGVLSILLLMKVAMDYVRQNLLLAQGVGFNKRLIRWFYTSILALPKKYFDGRTVGDFVARLNDGIRIQNFISRVAGSIVIDAFVVLTSIIYVWFLGRTIGIVLLLSILLNVSVIAYFQRSIIVAQREIMVAYAANESNYIDTIQGIGAIKTAGRGSFFASMTQKIYEVSQTKQLDLGRIAIAYAAITDASGIIISLSLMGWMSLQVISGWLALGKMMAAMSVVFGFIPAVGRISVASIQVQEARIAFDRMYGLVSRSIPGIEGSLLQRKKRDDRCHSGGEWLRKEHVASHLGEVLCARIGPDSDQW